MERKDFIVVHQFCKHHTIEPGFIHLLVEHSIIEVVEWEETFYFHLDYLEIVEKMIRLHVDFSINMEGLAVIFQLLEKNQDLQEELKITKNRLSLFEP